MHILKSSSYASTYSKSLRDTALTNNYVAGDLLFQDKLFKNLERQGLLDTASFIWTPAWNKTGNTLAYTESSLYRDLQVTRSTVKYVRGKDGVLTAVAANTPAVDYNLDSTVRGLSVEPQAINLLTRSEVFGTSWTSFNINQTANATIAPDLTLTAELLVANTTAGNHYIVLTPTTLNATKYTLSVYAKPAGYNFIRLEMGNNSHGAYFNLLTGTVVSTSGTATARIQKEAKGWYRCEITATTITTNFSSVIGPSAAGTTINFTGDNTSGVYVWGAQLELGEYASSYMKTEGTTFTREPDHVFRTDMSSVIGQTAGTIFVEAEVKNYAQTNSRGLLYLSDGSTNNRIALQTGGSSDEIQLISSTGGSTLVNINTNNNPSGLQQYAAGYALNDFVFYANSSSVGTDTAATVPPTSVITIGSIAGGVQQFDGWIRLVALYKTKLTSPQIEAFYY